ncbi:MAG: serine hydrolase [Myxococcaceae bacterium]|nr:serine hydrolase [Myxococcaceae bacterium]MCI0671568.1 serine hydrolase [Myxococcaceae bacterium]
MPALLVRFLLASALLPLAAGAVPPGSSSAPSEGPGPEAAVRVARALEVDGLFAPFRVPGSPGCAVAVARRGEVVLSRGYGLAHLELGVPITPDTVFEAGSVSKQFTAAGVMLLVQEGRLKLDAPVRTWLPELKGPGGEVTLRQMLHHTSGLRDWGTVVEAGGWPRGSRAYTHAHVLDVVRRQRALNYVPGTEYLYSNSGYSLATLVVERVSGQSLADFTRARIFAPLGMAHSRWRNDHTAVVPGRATAYSTRDEVWHEEMPFEDTYGHAALLTTVEDLLRWNENFVHATVGGRALVEVMQAQGRLNDGRELGYAAGLVVGRFRGVPEVSHTGATAGYRAFLGRYPAQHLSVALLCNSGDVKPGPLAHRVAEVFLADVLAPEGTAGPRMGPPTVVPSEVLAARAGLYRNLRTHEPLNVVARAGGLEAEGVGTLVPVSGTVFQARAGRAVFELSREGHTRALRLELASGESSTYAPAPPPALTPEKLAGLRGRYESDEAEVAYDVSVEEGRLVLTRRPAVRYVLEPLYADTFRAPDFGLVTFRRDARGRVSGFSLGMDRVRDLRFRRLPPTSPPGRGKG